MKVILYGSENWIGKLFIEFLKDYSDIECVPGTGSFENTFTLEDHIIEVSPTHIISFIDSESDILYENILDNLYSPLILADLCKKMNIHYTYIGTGCIFNLGINYDFDESSLPSNFDTNYSIIKGFTDRLMKNYSNSSLNLRIHAPMSSMLNSTEFIKRVNTYDKLINITVLDDFFPIFLDLMRNKRRGTYNCTNPGTITHHELMKSYRDLVDPEFEIICNNNFIGEPFINNLLIQSWYPAIKSAKKSIVNVLLKLKKNISLL